MKKILLFSLMAILFSSCASHRKECHAKKMKHKVAKFQEMDKNSNGKVNKKEFNAYMNTKFTKLDSNKDKQITEEEFLSHHKAHCKKGCKKACCSKKCSGDKACSHCSKGKCDGKSCKMKGHKCNHEGKCTKENCKLKGHKCDDSCTVHKKKN